MKARIKGKAEKRNDSMLEKNRATSIKNCFYSLLDIMEKDGNLSVNRVKRMFEISYSDDLYKIPDEVNIKQALDQYNHIRAHILELFNNAKGISDYKKIFSENMHLLDTSKLVSAMFVEIESLKEDETSPNYYFLKKHLLLFPMKDLISYNLDLDRANEEDKDKKIRHFKKEFKDSPLVPVYATTTSDEVAQNEKNLENIWHIEELVKVQKPEDVLEFATNPEAKFKLAYVYILYSLITFGKMPVYDDNTWEDCRDIHRENDGYLVETEALKGLISPSFISTDKFLLMSGYRALECLENEDYPIPKEKLISMCIEIEKAIKNKKIVLSKKYDVEEYLKELNSNTQIIEEKLKQNEIGEYELLNLYKDGKTTYSILSKYINPEKLSEAVSIEEVVEEYKKFKKDKTDNTNKFYRIAKLYRDNRIKYKNENGEILDDEYNLLKDKLREFNGNTGIIDFLKMGIFDVSSIISFDDEKLTMDAFKAGAFSKSDISMLTEFEILKERKIKAELESLPEGSQKEFIKNNIEDINQNPKRRFMYSIDPEARSINAGEGFEIFFVNDAAIIVDSLNKTVNSGLSTIIVDLESFEEEFGLGGINSSKLFNKKASGEISINKLAKQKCSQKGVSFGFYQNWSDVMMQILVGDEEERQSKYSEEDLAEQRKVIKLLNESLQK